LIGHSARSASHRFSTDRQQQQQPFDGLCSGTTRVGRYQKKHSAFCLSWVSPPPVFWIFMEQGKIMEAEVPTVWVSATLTGLTTPPPPQPPKVFLQAGCPSCQQRQSNESLQTEIVKNCQLTVKSEEGQLDWCTKQQLDGSRHPVVSHVLPVLKHQCC